MGRRPILAVVVAMVVSLLGSGTGPASGQVVTDSPLAFDIPRIFPNGRFIQPICLSCTFVRDGNYTKTDSVGGIITTFSCGRDAESIISKSFCAEPSREVIDTVQPDSSQLCNSDQSPIHCMDDDTKAATLWGDGRLDPNYLTAPTSTGAGILASMVEGDYRDMSPELYERFAFNSLVTPAVTQSQATGTPDIYAAINGNPYRTLVGNTGAVYPAGAGLLAGNPLAAMRAAPLFSEVNKNLVTYFGHDDIQWPDYQRFSGCSYRSEGARDALAPECFGHNFVNYVSSHEDISMVYAADYYTLDVDMVQGDANALSLLQTCYASLRYDNCIGAECLTGNTVQNGGLTYTAFRPEPSAVVAALPACAFTASVNILIRSTLSLRLPTGELMPYPFFVHTMLAGGLSLMRGSAVYWEESIDGNVWLPHPESISGTVIDLLRTNSFRDVAETLGGFAWYNGNDYWGVHRRVYYPTENNKFMRQVSLLYRGNTHHITPTLSPFNAFVPLHMMYSQSIGSTQIYMVSSAAVGNANFPMEWFGYREACGLNTLCNYFSPPTTSSGLYPTDGIVPGYGSASIRKFFELEVRNLVLDVCSRVVRNPVNVFLSNPQVLPDVCYRLSYNAQRLTCFHYSANSVNVGDEKVNTDVLRTFAEYVSAGATLLVNTQDSLEFYPVPKYVIGYPYTPTDHRDFAFVYDVPVVGSMQMENLWVKVGTPSCTYVNDGDPAPPQMPIQSNCNCINYPVLFTHCLCQSGTAYKATREPLPEGLTFSYPSFLAPYKFPVQYALKSRKFSHDTGAYNTVSLDCPTFLCANNRVCLRRLVFSNFMTFCENQKSILRSTLASLGQRNFEVQDTISVFMQENSVAPSSPLTEISPLGSSGITTGNLKPSAAQDLGKTEVFADSIANYFEKAREPGNPNQVSLSTVSRPEGYNYREPSTTPWEAFGLSLFSPVGVGVLTEKVNTVAAIARTNYNNIVAVKDYANQLGKEINNLASIVAQGFTASFAISVKLTNTLNTAIYDINKQFADQGTLNIELTRHISQLNTNIGALTDRVNFLDLVSSRATTLAIQTSAVLTKALEHEMNSREFQARVAACQSRHEGNSYLCTGSHDSILIGVGMLRKGSVTTLDILVLEPLSYTYAYGTAEFCLGEFHYLTRSSEHVFVLLDGEMYVTRAGRWAPQDIDNSNTLKLSGCRNPEIVLDDFSVSVPLVSLSNTATQFISAAEVQIATQDLVSLNELAQEVSNFEQIEMVNITEELVQLADAIQQASAINITSLEFQEGVSDIVSDFFDTGLSATEIALIVFVVLFVVIIIGVVLYFYCCRSSSSKFSPL